jgi:hypothetical protein
MVLICYIPLLSEAGKNCSALPKTNNPEEVTCKECLAQLFGTDDDEDLL